MKLWRMLFFGVLPFLCSCAALGGNNYSNIFNSQVADGKSTVVISAQPFDDLSENVVLAAKDLGYERVIYSRPSEGFFVLIKNAKLMNSLISGNAMNRQMMMKFTKHEGNQTRVDLVNAGTDLMAKSEVAKDIQTLNNTLKGF
jgi:hypothetical protein